MFDREAPFELRI